MEDSKKENYKHTLIVVLIAIIAILGVLLFQSTKTINEKSNTAQYLFVHDHVSGVIEPILPLGNKFTLTINNVIPHILYYSQGPTSSWGTFPLSLYMSLWEGDFNRINPNALIVVYDEGSENSAFVKLLDAQYSTENNTLIYTFQMESEGQIKHLGISKGVSQYLPSQVSYADIFIIPLSIIRVDDQESQRQADFTKIQDFYHETEKILLNSQYNMTEPYRDTPLNKSNAFSIGVPVFPR